MSTFDQPSDAYGFVQSARDKIRNIQPSSAPPVPDLQKVDEVRERVGFVSREGQTGSASNPNGPQPLRRPTVALNMRVPLDVANTFTQFCRKERYSYPEGLEEILKRAGLLKS